MESKHENDQKDDRQFTDPFQVKTFFTIKDDFDSDFVSMPDKRRQSIIPSPNESLNETNYFSITSDQTSGEASYQKPVDSEQDIDELGREFIKFTINQSDFQDKTIDLNGQSNAQDDLNVQSNAQDDLNGQSNAQDDLNVQFDAQDEQAYTLNSNLDMDPFDMNINTFESLSKDDPFKDDLFGRSNIDDSKFDEARKRFNCSPLDDEYENDSDVEFELPSNVTFLEPSSLEKHFNRFVEIDSLEKPNDQSEIVNENVNANKLENIPENDKESSECSDDEKDISKSLEADQIKAEQKNAQSDAQSDAQRDALNEMEKSEIKPNKAIEQWKIDNEKRIRTHDEEELKMNEVLKGSAKNELDEWYATYQRELRLKSDNNRTFQEQLVKKSKDTESSKSWTTVVDMCNFGQRNTGIGHYKDTSRLRFVLLQLKNSTTVA